jgi:hypothetical protein
VLYRWLDGEGFGFLARREPIPREFLWKLAYDGAGGQPAPSTHAAKGRESDALRGTEARE